MGFFFSSAVEEGDSQRVEGYFNVTLGFLCGSDGKESACNVGDLGLILGLGRSPGEGNGNPLQCSCLENFMGGQTGGIQSVGLQRVGYD